SFLYAGNLISFIKLIAILIKLGSLLAFSIARLIEFVSASELCLCDLTSLCLFSIYCLSLLNFISYSYLYLSIYLSTLDDNFDNSFIKQIIRYHLSQLRNNVENYFCVKKT